MTTVSLTVSQAFDIALKTYLAGKLPEAEQICLKLAAADPGSAAVLNLLAVISMGLGRNETALANFDRAVAAQPDFMQAWSNRGSVLKAMRRHDEALESFDRALALQPQHVGVINNRAGVLQELGRHAEALAGYDRALALQPDYPEALNNRAIVLQALGRHADALDSYDAALALRPDFVEAFVNRGIACYEMKRFDAALSDYDRAIALRPDHPNALSNRGNALSSLQRHRDALESYDAALALAPDHAGALYNRGVTLRKLGRLQDSLASHDLALSVAPAHPDTLVSRGITLHELKRPDEALASYDHAIALQADHVKALVNRGAVLHEFGRSDDALQSFDAALAQQPHNIEALSNRGVVLHELARYDEALVSHEQAVAMRPDDAAALNNRGITLHKLGRLGEALASFDSALLARPDFAEAFANRGGTLYELKRFEEALASCDRAITGRPDYADAHFLKGLASLVTGDFARGWSEYEWRHSAPVARLTPRDLPQPIWRGEEDIAGRTILLHSEQGFGDTIQFCRYAPLVASRGARVVLEVEQPLCGLMRGLSGDIEIIAKGDHLPKVDMRCPLPSLPLAFKTRLATIPAPVPYLGVPQDAIVSRRSLLGTGGAVRIGLCWAGNPRHVRDRERSMELHQLLPLLDVGAMFVSLQKQLRAGEHETLAQSGILDFSDRLHDFTDTAALISELDLVVSVDTSVAHLAGALGKPVWILLTHAPDWRWLLDRDDSPWYPTARLFRQADGRQWAGAVGCLHEALRQFAGGGALEASTRRAAAAASG
jgi:tetratricopeptide (TPR) repeat protein